MKARASTGLGGNILRFASVTDRLAGLGSSKWALHQEARRRAKAGETIIELTIGEPDVAPPQAVIDATIAALQQRRTRYSGGQGEPSILEALARKYSARTGRAVTPANIAYTTGTQTALFLAMTTLAEAGDEVLVGDPLYATYEGVIRATGADIVFVPLDPRRGFHLSADDLEARITPRSRVLLLNTPHNPTGATLDRAEIRAILDVCRRHDLWIVCDEVYETMAYRDFVSPFDEDGERVVVVSSISKSHMLPGFRAGWCVGPAAFITRMLPVTETMMFGAQPFIADGAAVAVSGDHEACRFMRETFLRRARLFPACLADAPGLACPMPEGGMFAMVDVTGTGLDGEAFARRLLDEESVAVMPGSSFGQQTRGHVRVSLTAPDEVLREAASRMVSLAARLKQRRVA